MTTVVKSEKLKRMFFLKLDSGNKTLNGLNYEGRLK